MDVGVGFRILVPGGVEHQYECLGRHARYGAPVAGDLATVMLCPEGLEGGRGFEADPGKEPVHIDMPPLRVPQSGGMSERRARAKAGDLRPPLVFQAFHEERHLAGTHQHVDVRPHASLRADLRVDGVPLDVEKIDTTKVRHSLRGGMPQLDHDAAGYQGSFLGHPPSVSPGGEAPGAGIATMREWGVATFEANIRSDVGRAVDCVLCAALTYIGFVRTRTGQEIDAAGLGATVLAFPVDVQLAVYGVLKTAAVVVLGLAALALGLLAMRRREWGSVITGVVGSAIAVLISGPLRDLLGRPDLGIDTYEDNTWPSRHVVVAFVLALSCLRWIPQGWSQRQVSAISATLILLVTTAGYSSIASYAHRPSDTIGSVLVAAAVFALLPGPGTPGPGWSDRERRLLVLVMATAALLALGGVIGDLASQRQLIGIASCLGLLGVSTAVLGSRLRIASFDDRTG